MYLAQLNMPGVTIDPEEPAKAHTPIERQPGAAVLLAFAVAGGVIFGVVIGCVAVATDIWVLALSPALVYANRFLLLGMRATAMAPASLVSPMVSIVVGSVVVLTVPDEAALPIAVLAALSLPALLIVTAVVDAHLAGTVWR
jgi:hypothetical protein